MERDHEHADTFSLLAQFAPHHCRIAPSLGKHFNSSFPSPYSQPIFMQF